MTEYIEREKALSARNKSMNLAEMRKRLERIPAADVRPVVLCRDCKYNNACLTQAFVEEESRVPFDRSTFFCADGERRSDA